MREEAILHSKSNKMQAEAGWLEALALPFVEAGSETVSLQLTY